MATAAPAAAKPSKPAAPRSRDGARRGSSSPTSPPTPNHSYPHNPYTSRPQSSTSHPPCPCGGGCPRCQPKLKLPTPAHHLSHSTYQNLESEAHSTTHAYQRHRHTSPAPATPPSRQSPRSGDLSTSATCGELVESSERQSPQRGADPHTPPQSPVASTQRGADLPSTSTPSVASTQRGADLSHSLHSPVASTQRGADPLPPTSSLFALPSSLPLYTVRPTPKPDASLSSGVPLRDGQRRRLEAFFSADFCAVRLHTGPPANALARHFNVGAFAYGNHIVLSEQLPSPDTLSGEDLLVHELTHCLQQSGQTAACHASSPCLSSGDAQPRAPPLTFLGFPSPQGFVEVPSFSDVGNALYEAGSGAVDTVTEAGGAAVDFATDTLASVVESLAPGLLPFLRGGYVTQITDLFCSGLDSLVSAIVSPLGSIDFMTLIETTFDRLTSSIQSVNSGLAAGASAVLGTLLKPLVDALQEFGGPVVQGISAFADFVDGILSSVWDNVGVPVLDFLGNVGGQIWETFTGIADWLERITGPIRSGAARAWTWLMNQFGLAWDSTEGIREWVADKAEALWKTFSKTIEPIKKPLIAVGATLVLLSPLGPIIVLTQVIPPLWDKIVWLWNNWNAEDILVEAREILANDILPGIIGMVTGVSSAIASAASWLAQAVGSVAEKISGVAQAFGAQQCLRSVTRAANHIADQFQRLDTWAKSGFKGLGDAVRSIFDALAAIFRPILDFLVRLIMVAINPPLLPIAITAAIWLLCPDELKPPVINFVLDFMAAFLRASSVFLAPLGPMASILKSAALGFLAEIRGREDPEKVAACNKIANIAAGGGPQFVAGYAVGLVRGLIDGILEPFRLIGMIIKVVAAICTAICNRLAPLLYQTYPDLGEAVTDFRETVAPPETPTGSLDAARRGSTSTESSSSPPTSSNEQRGADSSQPPSVASTQRGADSPQPPSVASTQRGADSSHTLLSPSTHAPAGPEERFGRPTPSRRVIREISRQPSSLRRHTQETDTRHRRLATQAPQPVSEPTTVTQSDQPGRINTPDPPGSALGQARQASATSEPTAPQESAIDSAARQDIGQLQAAPNAPPDSALIRQVDPSTVQGLTDAGAQLQGAEEEMLDSAETDARSEGASVPGLAGLLGGVWQQIVSGARSLGARIATGLLSYLALADYELGNKVGFIAGVVLLEVLLTIFTGGAWAEAVVASRFLRPIVRFLDLGGEILGVLGTAIRGIKGPLMRGLGAARSFISRFPTAARFLDRLENAARSLFRFGDEAAAASSRGARETAEEAAENATSRAGTRQAQEGAEEAAEQTARHADEGAGPAQRSSDEAADASRKAAELPTALAAARTICETNDRVDTPWPLLYSELMGLKARFRWIDTFRIERKATPGHSKIHLIASDHVVDQDYSFFEMGDEELDHIISFWQNRVGSITNPRRRAQAQQYLDQLRQARRNGDPLPRPSWWQTEEEVADFYATVGGRAEVPYIHGRQANQVFETPSGWQIFERGHTRPDISLSNAALEVKNYRLTESGDVARLSRTLRQQIGQRHALPVGAPPGGGALRGGMPYDISQQGIIIDVRGQNISRERLREIGDRLHREINEHLDDLADRSDLATHPGRRISKSDIQFITDDPQRIARKPDGSGRTPVVSSALDRTLASEGQPLPQPTRSRLESHFKQPLGHIQTHAGPAATHATQQAAAHAVSSSNHIVLGKSEYTRHDRILRHEVAHALQAESAPPSHSSPFLPEDSPQERQANQAETGRGQGESELNLPIGSSPSDTADTQQTDPIDPAQQQANPPSVAKIESNLSNSPTDLAHVPACGKQPAIRFTATPAAAAPITWTVADRTAKVASGTALTPSANTLSATLSLGSGQKGGELEIEAMGSGGGQAIDFFLASHPTGIKSTEALGDPKNDPNNPDEQYGGVFDHVFTSHDGNVASLQNVGVGERFPNVPNPASATHSVDSPFGKFPLKTGTLPSAASADKGNWFLTSEGKLGGEHDNVTISKARVRLGKHLVSDSNPKPKHPLPVTHEVDQDFHWWCPHSAANKRWTKFASTSHKRNLEVDTATKGIVFKTTVNGKSNSMNYDGETAVTNARADPATVQASSANGSPNTSQIDADIFPFAATAHFSIRGKDLGCSIDSGTGFLTIGTSPGTITIRVADSANGPNWDETNVTITAPSSTQGNSSPASPLSQPTAPELHPPLGSGQGSGSSPPSHGSLPPLRRSAWGPPPEEVPGAIGKALAATGEPLPVNLRATAESRLGYQLHHVRIHRDDTAAEAARLCRAHALAAGPHILLGSKSHDLHQPAAQRVLAHELVHTLQHPTNATPSPAHPWEPDSSPLEQQAHRAESLFASPPPVGRTAPSVSPSHSPPPHPSHSAPIARLRDPRLDALVDLVRQMPAALSTQSIARDLHQSASDLDLSDLDNIRPLLLALTRQFNNLVAKDVLREYNRLQGRSGLAELAAPPAPVEETEVYLGNRLTPVDVSSVQRQDSAYRVTFNQPLAIDQARDYIWPGSPPMDLRALVAIRGNPLDGPNRYSAFLVNPAGAPAHAMRPSLRRAIYQRTPTLEEALPSALPAPTRRAIQAGLASADASQPVTGQWDHSAHRSGLWWARRHGRRTALEYAILAPENRAWYTQRYGQDRGRRIHEAYTMFNRDMRAMVLRHHYPIRQAQQFLRQLYHDMLVQLVNAYVTAFAAFSSGQDALSGMRTSPGGAIGLSSGRLRASEGDSGGPVGPTPPTRGGGGGDSPGGGGPSSPPPRSGDTIIAHPPPAPGGPGPRTGDTIVAQPPPPPGGPGPRTGETLPGPAPARPARPEAQTGRTLPSRPTADTEATSPSPTPETSASTGRPRAADSGALGVPEGGHVTPVTRQIRNALWRSHPAFSVHNYHGSSTGREMYHAEWRFHGGGGPPPRDGFIVYNADGTPHRAVMFWPEGLGQGLSRPSPSTPRPSRATTPDIETADTLPAPPPSRTTTPDIETSDTLPGPAPSRDTTPDIESADTLPAPPPARDTSPDIDSDTLPGSPPRSRQPSDTQPDVTSDTLPGPQAQQPSPSSDSPSPARALGDPAAAAPLRPMTPQQRQRLWDNPPVHLDYRAYTGSTPEGRALYARDWARHGGSGPPPPHGFLVYNQDGHIQTIVSFWPGPLRGP